jgi:hypothetical protein
LEMTSDHGTVLSNESQAKAIAHLLKNNARSVAAWLRRRRAFYVTLWFM